MAGSHRIHKNAIAEAIISECLMNSFYPACKSYIATLIVTRFTPNLYLHGVTIAAKGYVYMMDTL